MSENIQPLLNALPGNVCPTCQARNSKVMESRHLGGGCVRRRRSCLSCSEGTRFTTYEIRVDSIQDFMDIAKTKSDELVLKSLLAMGKVLLSKPLADRMVPILKEIKRERKT